MICTKIATRRVGPAKSKRKSNKFGNIPWALKQKRKGDSKINDQIKNSIYNCIMHHPQFALSPIVNDCLKVKIDVHTEPQLVPKHLFHVYVREIHNNIVSDT